MTFFPSSLFWRRLLRYGGLALLALAALAFTAARLSLHYAEDYRADVEGWVSTWLGQPVHIGQMDARLQVLSPTLVLQNVQLLDRDGRQGIAQFREIRAGLALFASLRAGAPVLDEITVVGASLGVVRKADGSFQIQGLTLPDAQDSDPEAVGRWLMAQYRLALRDSRLSWRDERSGKSFEFEGVSLELQNDGARHQLNGRVRLPDDLGGALRVAVDMEGDPLTAGALGGEFYVGAERMQPVGLLRLMPETGVKAQRGQVSLEVWGELRQSRLVAAQGRISADGLEFLGNAGASERLDHFASRFAWSNTTAGWRLDFDQLVLGRAGRLWQPARWRVDLKRTGADQASRSYSMQASFLRLEDLAAIAALVPGSSDWQRQLSALGPRGDLHGVRIDYAQHGAIRAGAHFTDLALAPAGERPGFAGLDGYAWYDSVAVAAGVQLSSGDAQVFLPALFRDPLTLTHVSGELRLQRDGPAWLLDGRDVVAFNDDIHTRSDFALRLPQQGAPFLDLRGEFRDGRAVSVPRYLPVKLMPDNAVQWLDRAFKGGRVMEGGVLVHGPLDQFPFDHGEGRFAVQFAARDVELDYVPGWPTLNGIDGEVHFDGRRMWIEAQSAMLSGSRVSATRVQIPDLLHSRLQVHGQVDGELDDLFAYLLASGLAGEQFNEPLRKFQAGGRFGLELDFEQPLGDGGTPARAGGQLTFQDSRLAVSEGITLSEVRGRLRFDGERYRGEGITARLFGEPARLSVTPVEQEGSLHTRLDLSGAVDARALDRLPMPASLRSRLKGRTPWQAELRLGHSAGQESVLRARSTLEGMAISLPTPLGKPAGERVDASAAIWFSGAKEGEIEFAMGEQLAAHLALPAEGSIQRVAVHFGSGIPPLPAAAGYVFTGRLREFAPGAWGGLVAQLNQPGKATKGAAADPLPITIDLEELELVDGSSGEGGGTATRLPAAIPVIDVRVAQLSYESLPLGALACRIAPAAGHVALNDLRLDGPLYSLSGHGAWRRGRGERTELELQVTGKDLGAAARGLGVASVINKGTFDFQTKLAWPGDPAGFSVAALEGTVAVKVKDGVLSEVSPGAGRLLGLLSLQALPQRLTLDFRDLFDKGVRFRTFEGNFVLKDGDAFTDNLHMNALPAAVFVAGRTGLVRRDFDQTVTVVPDVSGNLPVAGGLALGPQVGAALLLVQQLFHKKIDEAGKFKYTVSGSWDHPEVKRVAKKR